MLGLIGGSSQNVFAAGELYFDDSCHIIGISAKTGHYFDRTDTFDGDVFQTTLLALRALKYDVEDIRLGDEFFSWTSGVPLSL